MKEIKMTRAWEHPDIDGCFGFTADVAESLSDEEFNELDTALVDATDDAIGLEFNGFDDSHYFNVCVVGYCANAEEIDKAADVLWSFGYRFVYPHDEPQPDLQFDSYFED